MNYETNYNSPSITHDFKEKGYRTGIDFRKSLNANFSVSFNKESNLSSYSNKKNLFTKKITEESYPNEVFAKSNYFSNFKDLVNDKYNMQRQQFSKPFVNPYTLLSQHTNPDFLITKKDFEMRKSQSTLQFQKLNGSPTLKNCYYISRDEDPNVTHPHLFGFGYVKYISKESQMIYIMDIDVSIIFKVSKIQIA